MPSSTRKLLVGLSAAGAVAAGFGATVQAGAEARTLDVTLSGGRTVVVNVDVPPGTPVEQIPLPDLGAPVVAVRDASPPATVEGQAATGTVPAPGATATTPATTTGATDPSVDSSVFDDSGGEGRQTAADEQRRRDAAERRKARTDGKKVTRRKKRAASDDAPVTTTTDEPRAAAAADVPNPSDPGFTEVLPGATPAGVPNFFIDKFRIPPFLLPIYQAAGIEYGVRWEVLAAINEVETDYGRNLSVSSAGAVGWMQFMPETWKAYGVDANGDGKADPYNPVDAIFAAARYLKAAGGHDHIRKAVFAYNHAGWYVDQVMLRARLVSGLPDDLVGSLTGLTQGVFPVASKTQYAGDDSNRKARAKAKAGGNAAKSVESSSRSSIDLYAKAGAPAIAVQDGTVTSIGQGDKLGRYVRLRDVYGNTYTYGNLKKVSALHPVAKDDKTPAPVRHASAKDPVPTKAASAGTQAPDSASKAATPDVPKALAGTTGAVPSSTPAAPVAPSRDSEAVFANPARPLARKHGGAEQLDQAHADDATFSAYLSTLHGLTKDDVVLKRLKKGSRVMAGTILGRLGATSSKASPHLKFQVRPAGKDAPLVDPKPILDGWKLLESTTVYRAKASSALFKTTDGASTGQVLLMSKEQLQERVLADPQLDIYAAGRRMVEAGAIDRRVLATLEYLTASGLRIGVSSLRRPGAITSSGNVSEHDSGNAVDISSVNGITISKATQGAGSITEQTIRILLGLQGTLKPHQIISLMTFEGADNTLAMGDHDDHIHVGFRPTVAPGAKLGKQVTQVLKPGQWIKLIDRIADIDNPTVVDTPSKYAVKAPKSGD